MRKRRTSRGIEQRKIELSGSCVWLKNRSSTRKGGFHWEPETWMKNIKYTKYASDLNGSGYRFLRQGIEKQPRIWTKTRSFSRITKVRKRSDKWVLCKDPERPKFQLQRSLNLAQTKNHTRHCAAQRNRGRRSKGLYRGQTSRTSGQNCREGRRGGERE